MSASVDGAAHEYGVAKRRRDATVARIRDLEEQHEAARTELAEAESELAQAQAKLLELAGKK